MRQVVDHLVTPDSCARLAGLGGALLFLLLPEREIATDVQIPRHAGPRFHVMPGQYPTALRATVPPQAGPVPYCWITEATPSPAECEAHEPYY